MGRLGYMKHHWTMAGCSLSEQALRHAQLVFHLHICLVRVVLEYFTRSFGRFIQGNYIVNALYYFPPCLDQLRL